MTRARLIRAAGTIAMVLVARMIDAQSAEPPRMEITVGPRWTGGVNLSGRDANETTSTGSPFRLFTASTTLARATSFDARVGLRLTRRLRALASGSYGRPTLRISASNDVENAAPATATERIQQFAIRGGAAWLLSAKSRFAPFAAGEIGYLRELHDGQTLVQTGRVVELGGGVTYPFASAGRFRQLGARLDARAVLRSKGAALDSRTHVAPAIGAALYFGF